MKTTVRTKMFVCVALQALAASSFARFYLADTRYVPIDRLIARLEKDILVKTNDVELSYALARVHSMAFAIKTNSVAVERDTGMPFFGYSFASQLPALRPNQFGMTNASAKAHLERAITLYQKAVILAPGEPKTRLGLAWCLDQAGDKKSALESYRKALALAWKKESEDNVMEGRSLTEETVDYMLPLLDPSKDAAEIETCKRFQTAIKNKGRSFTPI